MITQPLHRQPGRGPDTRRGAAPVGSARVAGEPVPFAAPGFSLEAGQPVRRIPAAGRPDAGTGVVEFEREFAAYVQAPHAVAVGSGIDAIEWSLRALRLPPRSRVLLPAMAPADVAWAVLGAGLSPALVDVDPVTAMPSPATVGRAVRGYGRPAAMVALHYAGTLAPVAELAEAAGLPLHHVVEDAAHALGAYADGHPAGAGSHAACFSFHATMNLPVGRGGMVTTGDERLAERLRHARPYGSHTASRRLPRHGGARRAEEATHHAWMTDAQAAVGRAQLPHLRAWQRRREVIAARYTAALHHLRGLECPAPPRNGCHAWHLYVLRVLEEFGTERDDMVALLAERGIGTAVHFTPLHHRACFRQTAQTPPDGLPGADSVSRQVLSLPMYPALPETSVDRVCTEIARLAGPAGGRSRTPLRPPP